MKRNVLVFPCGSEIGLEIYKSLSFSTHFKVFGGSSVDDHGKFVYENYINGIPYVDNPEFCSHINNIIEKYDIDYIIPAHDDVVLKLSSEAEKSKIKCCVLTSTFKTCEIARSKRKTYHKLSPYLLTPKIFNDVKNIRDLDLPVFLKPDISQGSKGTVIAETFEDINYHKKKNSNLLILEFLPGKEYTIDCFTNKKGNLLFCVGRERMRITNGISVKSARVNDSRFRKIAEIINKQIDFRGTWFFQVKENRGGDLVLMEFAPRVAGTMGLTRCMGVNLVLLSLFDMMDYDVEIIENDYDLVIDRALQNRYHHNINYKHVYLDFDDLVILDNKVNPLLIAFVFQCINKGIAVHLLTRHKSNITNSLKKYKLESIFKDITLVGKTEDKHKYINEKDAIFIDDSFAERKKVAKYSNIPVFDSHMIEALLERP